MIKNQTEIIEYIKNQTEIIEYINNLKGYCGYVQFSDRRIEDIWQTYSDIKVEEGKAFVYEAHFFNGEDSIAIRQINDSWFVDENKAISLDDTQEYISIVGKVAMVQIWKAEIDLLCDEDNKGMEVLKLKKVVFAGFVGDKK